MKFVLNKKRVVFGILLFVFAINFILASPILDELHLNLQTTDVSGGVVTGTFDFVFNISTTSDCNNVIYSNSTTLTTDSRGIVSYYLENVDLNYDNQYYLCYYRDSVLINNSKISRNPYAFRAKYVNVSGIEVDSNLSLTGFNFSADYLFGDASYLTNFNLSSINYWIQTGSDLHYSDGFVGIGTPVPSYALDVNGSVNINNGSAYLYGGMAVLNLSFGTDADYTSTFVGLNAGSFTTNRQTVVGYRAGDSSAGNSQTALGYFAGYNNSLNSQTAIGYEAGINNAGNSQTVVGYQAGVNNSVGYQTAIGYQSGWGNSGESQTVLGYSAGKDNSGDSQTVVGVSAGWLNTGDYQTAVGYQAGRENSRIAQTSVGYYAGWLNTGLYQTAVGYQAGYSNSGDYFSGFGSQAGYQNSGDYVTGIGSGVVRNNSGDNVVAIGYQAGYNNVLANQFIVKQANVNAVPLIQGNFSSGFVGIGTTSPSRKLHVVGDILSNATINATTDVCIEGGICLSEVGTGSGNVQGTGASNRVAFWTAADTISYDGNYVWDNTNKRLGIGTAAPQSRLNINGSAGNLSDGLTFGDGNTGFYEIVDNVLSFVIGGNESIVLNINNITANDNVYVSGDLNATGNVCASGGCLNDVFSGNLNSNSSNYWDGLDTPADISGSDISNDLNWINASGVVVAVGNWSLDKINYYLKSETYNQSEVNSLITSGNVNNSDYLDGYDSSFFMPLNTSVNGDFDFNGGWTGGGFSIVGGDIYAQAGYFYQVNSLQVSELEVNGSLIPDLDDVFDVGNSSMRWRNGYFSGNLNVTGFIYGNGSQLTSLGWSNLVGVPSGFSDSVDNDTMYYASEIYLYKNASNYFFLNETRLNNTIDARSILAETDPYWTANYSLYNSSWSSTYNSTYDLWAYNQTIPAINYVDSQISSVGNYSNENASIIHSWNTSWITDNQNSYNDTWINSTFFNKTEILGFSYYNSSDFVIGDYYLNSNPFSFYNSTSLQNLSQLFDDLGARGYTSLSNFTNDLGYITNLSSFTTDNLSEGSINLYSQWLPNGSAIYYDSGYVGIGTSTPQNNLNVVGDLNVTGTIYGASFSGVENYWNQSGNYVYPSNLSKYVGVGTATPVYALDVNGSVNVVNTSAYLYGGENALKLSKGTDLDYTSTIVGMDAGNSSVPKQTVVGYFAGSTGIGEHQTAVGYYAGYLNSALGQAAVGSFAGLNNSGNYQSVLGYEAGINNTGIYQTAIGFQAGVDNIGTAQTAIGYYAGYQNTGSYVASIGYESTYQNTGNYVSNVGFRAGYNNSGDYQSALGYLAGQYNIGDSQSAFGYRAGYNNTKNSQSVFGYEAGLSNAGLGQLALGYHAGYKNTANYQTAVGYIAGWYNTGVEQAVLGSNAGSDNSGDYQTAFGYSAGDQNTANNQAAFGYYAGYQNNGINQVAFGSSAGYQNNGVSQIATGYQAGYQNVGDYVVGIGYQATMNNSVDNVVAIGYGAGYNNVLANQFIVKQANVNAVPLIQGNFSSGHVGIGTNSPSETLEVAGSAKVSGSMIIGTTNITTSANGDVNVW